MDPRWPWLAPLLVAGCGTDDPDGPDPCANDPLGCAPPAAFEIDSACDNTDPLVARLAEGRDATRLTPLSEGDAPTVHYGLQGGQHLELGFIVDNPDPDHSQFRALFTVAPQVTDADEWLTTTREVVVGPELLDEDPSGGLALSGVVVFVEYETVTGDARIELRLEDTCGRTATVTDAFSPDA